MGYTKQQAEAFIEKMAPLIQTEAKARGYHSCAAVIAQAISEGACGTSKLAQAPYNNHFGLKCGNAWLKAGKPYIKLKTKEEYKAGVLTTIYDNFRVYSSMEECVKGYYDFIGTNRYANLKTATDYQTYAKFLKNDGYATDSAYINKICNVVVKYNLTCYDAGIGYLPTLKEGSKGEAVRNLQQLLTYAGYTLKIDGIYGPVTSAAVMAFQADRGLVVDNIVGPRTWTKLMEG